MIIENVPLAVRSFAIILAKDAIAKERNAIFVQQPTRAGLSSSQCTRMSRNVIRIFRSTVFFQKNENR